jgi:hypothetical protein
LAWNVYVVFAFLDGMLVKADREKCERPKSNSFGKDTEQRPEPRPDELDNVEI